MAVNQIKGSGYSNFRQYLNHQIIDLDYLSPDEPNRNRSGWCFTLAFVLVIVNNVKQVIIMCQSDLDNLSYVIGDFTIPAGKTKKQLTLIFFSWISATFMCILTLYRSQYTLRLQKWINIGVVFEHLSARSHPISGLPTILHRLFIRFNLGVFYSVSVSASLLVLPSFFIYPQQFFIYLWLWSLITIMLAFVIIAYAANFGTLYAFQVYIFAKQMNDLKNNLHDRLNYTMNNHPSKILTSLINHSVKSNISIMRELIDGHHFWIHFNQSIFLATFIAQSIIIYLIFFIDIPQFLRLAMILLGFINWIGGLSVHFFLGTYGQRKVNTLHELYLFIFIL